MKLCQHKLDFSSSFLFLSKLGEVSGIIQTPQDSEFFNAYLLAIVDRAKAIVEYKYNLKPYALRPMA